MMMMRMTWQLNFQKATGHSPKVETIFGVGGMLKLLEGPNAIAIAECECVGSCLGHPFFKVRKLNALPCEHVVKYSPD